jgi:hypothetical protein
MTAPAPHHPSDPAARARRGRLTGALATLLLLALALPLTLPRLMPSDSHAAAPLLGDADVHVDNPELEINVALSQTQNSCGATALNGQFCLRYSIEENETSVASGYGVIAASDVTMSGAGVTLHTNTASYPGFHRLLGKGGALSIHWTAAPGASPMRAHGRTSTLAPATVQGTVLGNKLAGAIVQADVLTYE